MINVYMFMSPLEILFSVRIWLFGRQRRKVRETTKFSHFSPGSSQTTPLLPLNRTNWRLHSIVWWMMIIKCDLTSVSEEWWCATQCTCSRFVRGETTDNFFLCATREAKPRPRAGSEAPILRVRPTTLPTEGCAANIRSEGKAPPIGSTYSGVPTRPSYKVGPFRSDCYWRRNSYETTTK